MAIITTNPTTLNRSFVMLKYSTVKTLADVLTTRFGKKPTVAGKDAAAQVAKSIVITVNAVTADDLRAIAGAFDMVTYNTFDYTLRRSGTGVRLEFTAAA